MHELRTSAQVLAGPCVGVDVGQLIELEAHRRRRRPAQQPAPLDVGVQAVELHVDLRSPWTYLVAERAERSFRAVRWHSVLLPGDERAPSPAQVTARADDLGLPLVWPDVRRGGGRTAMRVAHFAGSTGNAGRFVLAALRLAFCGGFDLDDPEILAEAAAAASLDLDAAQAAAHDTARDVQMLREGHRLAARGVDALPAFEIGTMILCGEHRLAAAAAAAVAHAPQPAPLARG